MNDADLRRIMAAGTQASIVAARGSVAVPVPRPGTVVGSDPGVPQVIVDMDGDVGVLTYAQPLNFLPNVGDRVMVLFTPPQGALVLGIISRAGLQGPASEVLLQAAGGANEDLTSGVFGTYPSNATWPLIPVPSGATKVLVHATLAGFNHFQSPVLDFRVTVGAALGTTNSDQSIAGIGGGDRHPLVWQDEIFVTGGDRLIVTVQGRKNNAATPGWLRRDTFSRVAVRLSWIP